MRWPTQSPSRTSLASASRWYSSVDSVASQVCMMSTVWIVGRKFLDASMLLVTSRASTVVLSTPRRISHSHIPLSSPSFS